MIDLPDPPKCPPALHAWLRKAREALMTITPIAGQDIQCGEEKDKGTTISATPCEPCP